MSITPRIATSLLLLLASCGGDPSTDHVAATRDSAGIRIVENAAPTTVAVTLSEAPLLVLGELDAPEVEQFGRVIDARLIPDGVAVLDPRNFRLVLFDLAGQPLRTIGRQGEGPGDMRRASRIVSVDADTVRIYDQQLRRITAFDTTGSVVGLITLPSGRSYEEKGLRLVINAAPRALIDSGRFVAATPVTFRTDASTGVYSDSLNYWVLDTAGSADSISRQASAVSWIYEFQGSGRRRVWGDSLPYAPRAADAFTKQAWWRVEGNRYEVAVRSWAGEIRRLIRSGRERAPVTDSDRAHHRARELAKAEPEHRSDLEVVHEWLVYPDSMPAYDQLAVDELDHVWARVFPDTAPTAPWDLFTPDGTLLGTVAVPADLEVRQIGADWLLATRKGSLDEPLVVLYRLTRHQ